MAAATTERYSRATFPEKDLTLSLARLIQHDLEAHGVATRMLRTGDNDLDFDQRAAAANSAHILAYIAIHAASEGRGVRLYTALLPAYGAAAHAQTVLGVGRKLNQAGSI